MLRLRDKADQVISRTTGSTYTHIHTHKQAYAHAYTRCVRAHPRNTYKHTTRKHTYTHRIYLCLRDEELAEKSCQPHKWQTQREKKVSQRAIISIIYKTLRNSSPQIYGTSTTRVMKDFLPYMCGQDLSPSRTYRATPARIYRALLRVKKDSCTK